MIEELEAGRILQIAEVLALIYESAASQCEDILEVPAHREQGWSIDGQRNRKRDVPAGATDKLRRSINYGSNGVIAALQDFAIVHQKCIGDVAQASTSLLVIDRNWFFAQVGRGHDQRLNPRIGKKEVL